RLDRARTVPRRRARGPAPSRGAAGLRVGNGRAVGYRLLGSRSALLLLGAAVLVRIPLRARGGGGVHGAVLRPVRDRMRADRGAMEPVEQAIPDRGAVRELRAGTGTPLDRTPMAAPRLRARPARRPRPDRRA